MLVVGIEGCSARIPDLTQRDQAPEIEFVLFRAPHLQSYAAARNDLSCCLYRLCVLLSCGSEMLQELSHMDRITQLQDEIQQVRVSRVLGRV